MDQVERGRAEVLLLGGRAGVGKTTVGWEVSDRLREAGVAHAIVEGDFMGRCIRRPTGTPSGRRSPSGI